MKMSKVKSYLEVKEENELCNKYFEKGIKVGKQETLKQLEKEKEVIKLMEMAKEKGKQEGMKMKVAEIYKEADPEIELLKTAKNNYSLGYESGLKQRADIMKKQWKEEGKQEMKEECIKEIKKLKVYSVKSNCGGTTDVVRVEELIQKLSEGKNERQR